MALTRGKVLSIGFSMAIATLWIAATSPGASASEAEEVKHEESHGHHRHHVAALLGAAIRDEHGVTEGGFAVGVDYEYRLHRLLGAGALVEVATGNIRDVVVMAPIFLHPWGGLKLVVAPGAEIASSGHAEFLLRVGGAYLFPLGDFSVGPDFVVDIVDGHPTFVAGLAFGVGFYDRLAWSRIARMFRVDLSSRNALGSNRTDLAGFE